MSEKVRQQKISYRVRLVLGIPCFNLRNLNYGKLVMKVAFRRRLHFIQAFRCGGG